MKYSVLAILLATGYIGLMIAGLTRSDDIWRLAASLAWLAATGYTAVCAFHPSDRRAATFGRVMLSGATIYVILAFLPNGASDWLPHPIIARIYLLWGVPEGYVIGPDGNLMFGSPASFANPYFPNSARYEPEPIVALCAAQVFGLIMGFAATWKYRKSA